MALSFAGTRLTVPTPEAAAWVEKNISTRDLYPWDVQSRVSSVRVGLTVTGQLAPRPVRLNCLRWPVGACEWATCFLLASTNQLGDILSQTYTNTGLNKGTLLLSGPRGQVEAQMYLLPPRPLAQLPFANGMWLLPLVDQRYWWWQATVNDVKAVPPDTWEEWFTRVENILTTINPSVSLVQSRDIPASYLLPSGAGDLGLSFADIPPLLDSLAYNVGCRVMVSLDGDTVTVQDPLAAADAVKAQYDGWPVLAGGRLPLPLPGGTGTTFFVWWNPEGQPGTFPVWSPPPAGAAAGVIPTTVSLTFPKSTDTTSVEELSCTPAQTNEPDLVGLPTGPGVKTFRSGVRAEIDSGGAWTNEAELQNLTETFATDWYRWQLSPLDVVFAGVVPWGPEGFNDIEWCYRTDMVATRVSRQPYDDRREELLHDLTPARAGGGGPQPITHVNLAAATNDVDVSEGAGGGYLWIIIDSATDNPSSIHNFTGGVTGELIEVTNASGQDVELADAGTSGGNILCPVDTPPNGNTAAPAFNVLHDRETALVKFDGTHWRVLERQPHLLVGSNEFARSRMELIPCCTMGIWATDDHANDSVKVQIGTVGKTTTVTVVSSVDFVNSTVTSHVLTFTCGVLTAVDGA